MPKFSRFLALCILSASSAGAQATSQKPTLVVMITIDGFRQTKDFEVTKTQLADGTWLYERTTPSMEETA